jgi:hypothetical protein
MALSVIEHGGRAVVVANPIFVISESDTKLTFDVLEHDSAALIPLIGKWQTYAHGYNLFFGQLKSLDTCESTHPGLALLREKATLRAVFLIFKSAGALA